METTDQPTTLVEHMNLLRVISLATHSLAVRAQNYTHSDSELIEEVHRVAALRAPVGVPTSSARN
jgi:hypothetical protein